MTIYSHPPNTSGQVVLIGTGVTVFQVYVQHTVLGSGPLDPSTYVDLSSRVTTTFIGPDDRNWLHRASDAVNNWMQEHDRALTNVSCVVAPPGAVSEIQGIPAQFSNSSQGSNPDPASYDSYGASPLWLPNNLTQRNGGNSIANSAPGAVYGNAYAAGLQQGISSLSCAF